MILVSASSDASNGGQSQQACHACRMCSVPTYGVGTYSMADGDRIYPSLLAKLVARTESLGSFVRRTVHVWHRLVRLRLLHARIES